MTLRDLGLFTQERLRGLIGHNASDAIGAAEAIMSAYCLEVQRRWDITLSPSAIEQDGVLIVDAMPVSDMDKLFLNQLAVSEGLAING